MGGAETLIGQDAAASLMRWWRDAGVDVLVEDAPRNWLAASHPLPAGESDGRVATRERGRVPDCPAPGRATPDHRLSGGEQVELPDTLPALLDWLRDSPDAPEAGWGRTRTLPAGDPHAGLMILTDMPEPGDAEAGVLMAGELGALFDKMLAAIGRDRASVWLAPLASVRPVGGRVPAEAAKRLAEIGRRHIGLVAPKRLLIMGDLPNRALIGPDWQTRRGALHSINLGAVDVEAVATFHPRLLLERPAYKAQAWKDLQLLMKGL